MHKKIFPENMFNQKSEKQVIRHNSSIIHERITNAWNRVQRFHRPTTHTNNLENQSGQTFTELTECSDPEVELYEQYEKYGIQNNLDLSSKNPFSSTQQFYQNCNNNNNKNLTVRHKNSSGVSIKSSKLHDSEAASKFLLDR